MVLDASYTREEIRSHRNAFTNVEMSCLGFRGCAAEVIARHLGKGAIQNKANNVVLTSLSLRS